MTSAVVYLLKHGSEANAHYGMFPDRGRAPLVEIRQVPSERSGELVPLVDPIEPCVFNFCYRGIERHLKIRLGLGDAARIRMTVETIHRLLEQESDMPEIFPDGQFTEHNKTVRADIASKRTIHEAFNAYVGHINTDAKAAVAAGASIEQALLSVQALEDNKEDAFRAIVENTSYKDVK